MARTAATTTKGDDIRPTSRRLIRLFVSSVVAIGIVFTFVNPTRQWLDQRGSIAAANERVSVLDQKSKELADRAAQLRTDAEIERLAREQYGLVKPGEEAYAILPAPGATQQAPPPPPKRANKSAWQKVWDKVQLWR